MDYYDSEERLDEYEEMSKGADASALVERLRGWVPAGARVLELGMGPGRDLDLLRQYFEVTGSDRSRAFLERYRRRHNDADLLVLDATQLETSRTFDAIFSNKVLHHLSPQQLESSLLAQQALLEESGVLVHSLWHGDESLVANGLLFQHYTEERLLDLVPKGYDWLACERYTELFADDSLLLALRRTP